ncbi:MAG: SDR family NAD(P)-dependent oxidoreductase [Bacteroidetes bacterium]|nr:SDR family NAD(P)-dependent oxidoreductase [Bacteroidota bacterium]
MKTILITGSTDGLGKLAAIKLAKAGNELLLHGRSAEKLDKVISEVKEAAGHDQIHGFVGDLSDFERVREMAEEIKAVVSKIDVMINNAGVYSSQSTSKPDIRLVVNYLAPVLLTNALHPLLKKAESPRLINLSSAAQSPVSVEALKGRQEISEREAYAQSKLALTMWSFYLAQSWKFCTVIAVNPGSLLNTKMVQEAFGHHWSPAEKGVNVLVDLAVAESYLAHSGAYFDNDKGAFGHAHPDAYDQKKVMGLISATRQILLI